jgi:uncharacterized protein
VSGLGAKTFELSAGFLRIPGGDDPLDASGVHPEAYPVVRRILEAVRSDIKAVIGNGTLLKTLKPQAFTDASFGLPTVTDILKELEKPGRDPRPEFRTATFQEGVETLKDLKPGMVLEGVVTNVAAFGAFVDIGVHQDGLVHISALSNTFVKDPRTVVKPGDIVKVKVLEVDAARKRIGLSMRMDDGPARREAHGRAPAGQETRPQGAPDRARGGPSPKAPAQSPDPRGRCARGRAPACRGREGRCGEGPAQIGRRNFAGHRGVEPQSPEGSRCSTSASGRTRMASTRSISATWWWNAA